jgi:hypothetical protein
MIWPWHWLVDPANGPTVSAVGLLISVVGFPITIVQLIRTRRAAVAAKDAADNATLRLNSFSALRECEAARLNANSINDAIAEQDWDKTLILYQQLSKNLSDLVHCNIDFDVAVTEELQTGVDIIEVNCKVIERLQLDAPDKLTRAKQFHALRKIDPRITKTFFNLERLSS